MHKIAEYSRVRVSAKLSAYGSHADMIHKTLTNGILDGTFEVESATVTETKVTRYSNNPRHLPK